MAKAEITGRSLSARCEVNGRHFPESPFATTVSAKSEKGKVKTFAPMAIQIDDVKEDVHNLLGNHQIAVQLAALEAARRAHERGVTDLIILTPSHRVDEHEGQRWKENDTLLRTLNWALPTAGNEAFDSFDVVT